MTFCRGDNSTKVCCVGNSDGKLATRQNRVFSFLICAGEYADEPLEKSEAMLLEYLELSSKQAVLVRSFENVGSIYSPE